MSNDSPKVKVVQVDDIGDLGDLANGNLSEASKAELIKQLLAAVDDAAPAELCIEVIHGYISQIYQKLCELGYLSKDSERDEALYMMATALAANTFNPGDERDIARLGMLVTSDKVADCILLGIEILAKGIADKNASPLNIGQEISLTEKGMLFELKAQNIVSRLILGDNERDAYYVALLDLVRNIVSERESYSAKSLRSSKIVDETIDALSAHISIASQAISNAFWIDGASEINCICAKVTLEDLEQLRAQSQEAADRIVEEICESYNFNEADVISQAKVKIGVAIETVCLDKYCLPTHQILTLKAVQYQKEFMTLIESIMPIESFGEVVFDCHIRLTKGQNMLMVHRYKSVCYNLVEVFTDETLKDMDEVIDKITKNNLKIDVSLKAICPEIDDIIADRKACTSAGYRAVEEKHIGGKLNV